MLKRISLHFGSSPSAEPLVFEPGTMTIVVGPNNSGKTMLVQELSRSLHAPDARGRTVILDQLDLAPLTTARTRQILSSWDTAPIVGTNEVQLTNTNPVTRSTHAISGAALDEGYDLDALAPSLLSIHTLLLDGRSRLAVLADGESQSLRSAPKSVVMSLLRNDVRRARLRKLGFEAFGRHFVIDITEMRSVTARMSDSPPPTDDFERSVSDGTVAFMKKTTALAAFSDGIQAYLGILAAAVCSEFQIILIDEPEAFLHPPLQRALGQELASLMKERSGCFVAATHSSEFLMGCIQSGVSVNILRLTYDADVPTAMLLPQDELATLCRNPLIRSSRFLTGLFHRAVVVCEGDSDRVFYEEVLRRVGASRLSPSDILVLNGLGKSTVPKLVGPLRRLGIPAAAIVDLDIVKESDLSQLLRSAQVPDDIVAALGTLKGAVKEAFAAAGKSPGDAGIDVLPAAKRESAERLISDAAEYGVFIVGVGKLENWLGVLNVTARKHEWLGSVLDALESNGSAPVLNMEGDVWAFVRRIVRWIEDPGRKGMHGTSG